MISRAQANLALATVLFCFVATVGWAQPGPGAAPETVMPSVTTVPAAALPSDHFSAEAATEAYMAEIPATAKARSDSYFEGGYWLILWDFLYGAVILVLLLNWGWSARMRDLAEGITARRWMATVKKLGFWLLLLIPITWLWIAVRKLRKQEWSGTLREFVERGIVTFLYWVQFLLVTSILGFPLTVYEGYFREHQYGLATQSFGPWMNDQFKALLINLILAGIIVVLLFAIVRRLRQTWWIWGALVTIAFMVFTVMIVPIYIVPVFNTVKPLNDPKVTQPILRLAHANGIETNDVYEMDASKQTTRMSANVSGFGKTMRITLNDNLLRRGSPEEIQAVMGHEMGHYVLNHIPKDLLFFGVVIVVGFAFLKWALQWSLTRWGDKWQVRDIGDPAVLPLVVLLASIFFFVLTPFLNTHIRTTEREADMYGLNASRQPDGFAQAAIHLGEYRKMKPGPLEEYIFFDHPSGWNRIYSAMRWKAENLNLFTAQTSGAATTSASNAP